MSWWFLELQNTGHSSAQLNIRILELTSVQSKNLIPVEGVEMEWDAHWVEKSMDPHSIMTIPFTLKK